MTEPQIAMWTLATGGLMAPRECAVLAQIAGRATGPALEVGHYTGLSTIVLAHALPEAAPLTTVDTHEWRRTRDAFFANVRRYGHGTISVAEMDYQAFLATYTGPPWGFVFYDGPHSDADCDAFWAGVSGQLAPDCLFLFDDADWRTMARLHTHVQGAGFAETTPLPLERHAIAYTTGDLQTDLDLGKRHPDTYTLAVYERRTTDHA